ncbi:hypothetical protein [Pedobacter sp. Leaf176]|uniref:hypothetical protein n=1 Tax=Pedobacter sp. Leaf176 TaxID=1736286 RepID=UPI0006F49403|nr:hypothetical protein [Pedobacter sp. Leaf176]KQR67455.1 hypothetical protein ASF92_17315 [Pedobacter sp. Leaf176]
MKKLLFMLLLALAFSIHFESKAQVDVNVNIGSQPSWGPSGYDYVDYYYLPDIESYYYVPKKQFIYMGNNGWLFTTALPPKYKGYNLYNGYKVVINSPSPYMSFKAHKVKYAKYKGNHGQSVIGKNKKYTAAKGNSNFRKSVSHQKVKPMKAQQVKGNWKGNHQGNGKGKH